MVLLCGFQLTQSMTEEPVFTPFVVAIIELSNLKTPIRNRRSNCPNSLCFFSLLIWARNCLAVAFPFCLRSFPQSLWLLDPVEGSLLKICCLDVGNRRCSSSYAKRLQYKFLRSILNTEQTIFLWSNYNIFLWHGCLLCISTISLSTFCKSNVNYICISGNPAFIQ